MLRCRTCTENQHPNFVLVVFIDEDEDWGITYDERYFNDATLNYFENESDPNYPNCEQEGTCSGAAKQFATYINDLNGSFAGFMGIVLVPVYTDTFYDEHIKMKSRMEIFRNTIDESFREKIIILGTESDPSGVAQINREDDYSEKLITAIETLRQPNDEEDEEAELLELNYIINLIDDSGSHHTYDLDAMFNNYFIYFTDPFSDGTNPAVDLFNTLEPGPDDNDSLVTSLIFPDGANWNTALGYGIGTRHYLQVTGERWPQSIIRWLYTLAAHGSNNWIENCRKMCNHRWTTDVGYLIPMYGELFNIRELPYGDEDPQSRMGWIDLQPDQHGASLDVYELLYNKREAAFPIPPEDLAGWRRRMNANFPYHTEGTNLPNDFQTVGVSGGGFVGFTASPFKDAIFNFDRFVSNCPCYMFDPVRNYYTEKILY